MWDEKLKGNIGGIVAAPSTAHAGLTMDCREDDAEEAAATIKDIGHVR